MSNLEFMWILIKALWPFSVFAGFICLIILIDMIHGLRNRKGKKYVAIHNR